MIDEKRTLLIVDDESSCREAFCVALEDEYNLIEAETGEQALEILQSREDIGLVLLDYLLPPGIYGLEVLERMRELKCKVPVIVVTGKGSEEVCRIAFKMGVQDYIQKPFKVKKLQEAIRGTIDLSSVKKSPMDRAVEFMEEQYCRHISARDVAQDVGLSLDYLESLFKKKVGHSITHHICYLRIEKAKRLLLDRNVRIKEIASNIGFNDQAYFCKFFKKHTGCTPIEYRDRFG
jgi:two-component system response regulator YesN